MPELPEVETVRRGLTPALIGRRFSAVEVRRPDLRWPLPSGFAERLTGRTVIALERRGKYLILRLDDGMAVIAHLGMSGRMRVLVAPPEPAPHDHVVFRIEDGPVVLFTDPRRFGSFDLCPGDALPAHRLLRDLGPEPLESGFTGRLLAERFRNRKVSVKTALMDQKLIAGIGNIYASEALYRARLSPNRKAASVRGRRADALAAAIGTVLDAAIAAGGSSLRDHSAPDGTLGLFQHGFAVYARAGLACPDCQCDIARSGGIRRTVQGGRATFYCPALQR